MRHAVSFLAILLLPSVPAFADGGDIIWTFQGIEDIRCVAELPDQNDDGAPEVVIETYDAGAVGDHLYCLSGGDSGSPEILWSIRPESGASNGGGYSDDCLMSVPDLSGDGYPDVILGTAWGNRSVHAVDGMAGTVLWTFDTYLEFDSGWIYSVDAFPDRTGDGLPEIACAVGSDNNAGYLLDGADGSVIFRFVDPFDALYMTRVLPDVNDDGVSDVIFAAGDNDYKVYCVSGASSVSGQEIWSANTGGSNYALCLTGDVDGDGVDDLVTGTWTSSNQVKALSGASGAQLWTFNAGSYNYIMRLVSISDADGDGFPDIAIGSWDNGLRVVNGRTGDLIWVSYAGTTNGGDFWALDRVDDLTGDGVDEVVGASFDTKVYLFNGATGDTLWIRTTGRRHYTVRGVSDLNDSGAADLVAGQQYLGGGGFAYALEGGSATPVESWPSVHAKARMSPAGGVSLSWTCEDALPFFVYRLDEAAGREAGRELIARAHESGRLGASESVDLIRSQENSYWIRLNELPLLGDDGYTFEDYSGGLESHYRLAGLMDGEELVLAEIRVSMDEQPVSSTLLRAGIHPNPFNPATVIRFELLENADLRLMVHDGSGRRVVASALRSFPAGEGEWSWTAPEPLPSGVYFFTLEGAGERRTLRAVLVK